GRHVKRPYYGAMANECKSLGQGYKRYLPQPVSARAHHLQIQQTLHHYPANHRYTEQGPPMHSAYHLLRFLKPWRTQCHPSWPVLSSLPVSQPFLSSFCKISDSIVPNSDVMLVDRK